MQGKQPLQNGQESNSETHEKTEEGKFMTISMMARNIGRHLINYF